MKRYAWLIVGVILCCGVAQAAVWMPSVFSDHMVLQRDKLVPVWGWAAPGEKVTVTFAGQKKTATADKSGKWMVRLDVMKASNDGRALVVRSSIPELVSGEQGGGDRSQEAGVRGQEAGVTFTNVVVGEVWLCSGQSNMEWRLNQCESKTEALARADYPLIRLFGVARKASPLPLRDVNGTWEVCSPDTAGAFSGVGFFFGERLNKDLDMPVGLIASSWGGSGIRAWMPPESFSMFKYTEEEADLAAKTAAEYRDALKKMDVDVHRKWADEAEAALVAGREVLPLQPLKKTVPAGKQQSSMFNGMIAPLIPYAMRGVIWYQGESNGADGMGYRDMTEAMLTAWRTRWGDEAFPFYYVQICTFFWYGTDYHLLDMWEAQTACLKIPNTGMVGTSDISQPWTWHPRNKCDVGNRLALWALAKDYPSTQLRTGGKAADLVYSGPMYKSVKFSGNKAIVTFDHTAKGLKSLDGKPLTNFMLSGKDKVFHNAEAKIDGAQVILTAKEVSRPVAARCGWVQTSEPNLGNSAGLPVINFRTDDWKHVFSAPRLGPWYANGGEWSMENGIYTQVDDLTHSKLVTGIRAWSNYTFEVELRKTGGMGSVKVYYRMAEHGFYAFGVDWDGNGEAVIKAVGGGTTSTPVDCGFETGKWYKVKVVVKDNMAEVFLDGKSILTHTDKKTDAHKTGGVGVGGMKCKAQFRNMKLTDESGKVLRELVPE